MAKTNKAVPLALSLDEDLIRMIDLIAKECGESRSALLRSAIREGIAKIEHGGSGDAVFLDGELSNDVAEVERATGATRGKVLLESVRAGLQAFYDKAMREKVIHSQNNNPDEAARLLASMEHSKIINDPRGRELHTALVQRGALQIQMDDLLEHCPEARERKEVLEKVVALHRKRHGSWPSLWGGGLSTSELKRQLAELESGKDSPASELTKPAKPAKKKSSK